MEEFLADRAFGSKAEPSHMDLQLATSNKSLTWDIMKKNYFCTWLTNDEFRASYNLYLELAYIRLRNQGFQKQRSTTISEVETSRILNYV